MPTENIDYADKSTGDNFTAGDANEIKSVVNNNAALQLTKEYVDDKASLSSILIASSDATQRMKDTADAVCSGEDDHITINEAITEHSDTPFILEFVGTGFNVSGTINIDVSVVRGIIGNNANFTTDADEIVFYVFGGLTSGSASPLNSNTDSIKVPEMNPFVRNLRVRSTEDSFIGTGMRVRHTFGITVSQCHFYDLKHGLEFYQRSRNPIVYANHIYNCSGYGLYLNNPEIHQFNIIGNHISYCLKAIFCEDSEPDNVRIHDLQLIGNDIESSSTPENVKHIIHVQGFRHEGWQIVGNTIEDHDDIATDGAHIYFESGGPRQVHIVANELGNNGGGAPIVKFSGNTQGFVFADNSIDSGAGDVVWFDAESLVDGAIISNNVMIDIDGYLVRLSGAGDRLAINVTGNIITKAGTTDHGGRLFIAEGTGFLQLARINGNSVTHGTQTPYIQFSMPHNTCEVSNNLFEVHTSQADNESAVILLKDVPRTQINICENSLRGRGNVDRFVGFENVADSGQNLLQIKNNSVNGLRKLALNISIGDNSIQTEHIVVSGNSGFKTEARGTATIPSGSTSVQIAHGIGPVPSQKDVMVSPLTFLGNATQFRVGTTGNNFTNIHLDQDPGQDVEFSWQVNMFTL